jgi:hypothetical protein
MHNSLAIIAGLVAIVAMLPYIRDIIRGKTRPNVVTWFTWSLLNLITAAAAFSGHAMQTAIFAGATGLCTLTITILGLKKGIKKYTKSDYICQALAICSILAWQLSNTPALAVVFTITASFIGSVPTIRHAWLEPHEETWQFFAIDGFAALLACLSVESANFLSIAFPLYIALDDSLITLILVSRRNK